MNFLQALEDEESELKAYQPPFCGACGVVVSDKDELEDYVIFAEDKDYTFPVFWTCLYRAVIRQKCGPTHQKQPHHLSGVSRLYYLVDASPLLHQDLLRGKAFSVPWDKNRTVTERSHMIKKDGQFRDERTLIYPANFWDDRHRDLYPHGFPIHAYCWSMIERIIGPSAENDLDLFLEVLFQIWDTEPHPFEVSNCIGNRSWGGMDSSEALSEEELHAVWDPTDVPEIQAILRQSTKQEVGERSKMRSSGSQNLGTLDISLDVIHQILDYLPVTDIENILTATQLQLPNLYWRSRFPRQLIFEADEFISAEAENANVDWRFLCLEIEKLLGNESLHGLQNRQRIFRILEGTKELFLSRLRL